MSLRASCYAKELTVCPTGELISPREKLVIIALADLHQDKTGFYLYPAVRTIAASALCDERSCQRYLGSLERKGVIKRLRPPNQGRGMTVFYFFCELESAPEGWQAVTLLLSHKTTQKDGRRTTEGRQKGDRACTPSIGTLNFEQKQQEELTPPTPSRGEGERVGECPRGATNETAIAASTARAIDQAESQVMRECGFTARRLRSALRAVILLEVSRGEEPDAVASAMVAAWEKYTQQDCNLRAKWGARRFFEEGYWKEPRSWHYDTELIRMKLDQRSRSIQ